MSRSLCKSLLCMLACGALQASVAHGATYYVSDSSGVDSAGRGTSPSTAFKTIQYAANQMLNSGDECVIYGGVYRETVAVMGSGVTFRSATGETVVVSGANPITGWTLDNANVPNVYRATAMPSGWTSLGVRNQFFQGTSTQASLVMRPEARWPNAGPDFPWENSRLGHPTNRELETWTYVDSGSVHVDPNYGTIIDAQLPSGTRYVNGALTNISDGYWNGARVHIMAGAGFFMHHPQVTAYSHASRTITTGDYPALPYGSSYAISGGNEYYLTGKKGELDSDGEWFYDTSISRFCVYSSGGVPASGAGYAEVKTRHYGFDLRGRSAVTLKDLGFFACTIQTDSSSTDCVFNGLKMKYLSHNSITPTTYSYGFILPARSVLRNSELSFDSSNLITLDGADIRVYNNKLHDSGYVPDWAAMLEAYDSNNGDDNSVNTARRALVSHNSMYNSGRAIMGFAGGDAILEFNDIYNGMRLCTDGGIVYCYNVGGSGSTELRYNRIHDSQSAVGHIGASVKGVYIDNMSDSWLIHHNIIWGVPGHSMHFGSRQNFHQVFNNTCWDAPLGALGTYLFVDGLTGSAMFNNLFNASSLGYSAEQLRIWDYSDLRFNLYSDPSFVDTGSFQLTASSPAVNRGTPIPGITDGYVGSAPDLGALERGGTNWTASVGYNASNANTLPTYVASNYNFTNKVVDGSFMHGVLASPWEWTAVNNNLSMVDSSPLGHGNGCVRSGNYSLQFAPTGNSSTAEIRQTITGLLPGRKYILYCGVLNTDPDAEVRVGVRNYGNDANGVPMATLYQRAPVSQTGSWYLSLRTADTLMLTTPFSTGATADSAQIYVSVKNASGDNVYVDDVALMLAPGVDSYAPNPYNFCGITDCLGSLPLARIEAETLPLNKTEAPGGTVTVSALNGYNQASQNTAVLLGDIGDALQLSFTAPQSSYYRLKLRVRSSETAINGYAIQVDGTTVPFIADGSSIVLDTTTIRSTTYWGTLVSGSVFLAAGTHSVSITALAGYKLVDYLDVEQKQLVEAETSFTIVANPGSVPIYAINGYNQASLNTGVLLGDPGDAIQFNCTAPQNGTYILNLRVRAVSGIASFKGGYAVKVDGQTVAFNEDMNSIVLDTTTLRSTTYWGTLFSPVMHLTAGAHTIEITAVSGYKLVDFLDMVQLPRIEAETLPLNKLEVSGGSINISALNGYNQASESTAVLLGDVGDALQMNFNVPQTGTCVLNLRVRSGGAGNDRSLFSGGYGIKVDGQTVVFAGDPDSIVLDTTTQRSTTYWGTLVSYPLQLTAGTHTIEVTGLKGYCLVDCLDVRPQPAQW